MSRSSGANKLCPWIENVILSYNDGTEQQTHRRLKAHVVGVGDMSQSQAQTAQQGTTELIFLSDGVVQIPAVLTASAWEDLQDREDRECSSGLVDATVRVLFCHLVFHMHPQVNRCRFFLSVDKLATVAAGPRKEHPPPCTTLFSVRQHICKTWRLARQQQSSSAGSQNSQLLLCGFDLSQLLGTWDKDTLHDVQADVLKALGTSPCDPPTSWEGDRVTAEPFVIPVCHLLIPEEEARQPQASSETQSGILHRPEDRIADVPSTRVVPMIPVAEKLLILPKIPVSAVQPSAGEPEIVERGSPPGSEDTPPQDHTLLDKDETAGLRDKASPKSRSNPWDAFPPPGSSPCSDGSIAPPEAVPPETLTDAGVPSFPLATSTQVSSSSKGSSDISQTSEQSKGEQSSIHPYQNPQPALRLGPLSNSSTSGSTTGSLSLFPHTKNHCSQICSQLSTHPLPLSGQENLQPCVLVEKLAETHQEEKEEVALRKRKRKLHHCNSDMLPACVEEEKEDGVVPTSRRSPPSWLFERQEASGADAGSGPKQTQSTEEAVSPTVHYSAVHGDGTPFSYAYKPAGQLLLDLSRFKVPDGTLQWAAKYLKSDG